jgi:hypothetical protein
VLGSVLCKGPLQLKVVSKEGCTRIAPHRMEATTHVKGAVTVSHDKHTHTPLHPHPTRTGVFATAEDGALQTDGRIMSGMGPAHTCTHAHMHTCKHAHMHTSKRVPIRQKHGRRGTYAMPPKASQPWTQPPPHSSMYVTFIHDACIHDAARTPHGRRPGAQTSIPDMAHDTRHRAHGMQHVARHNRFEAAMNA